MKACDFAELQIRAADCISARASGRLARSRCHKFVCVKANAAFTLFLHQSLSCLEPRSKHSSLASIFKLAKAPNMRVDELVGKMLGINSAPR
jgi:hypothetical protein